MFEIHLFFTLVAAYFAKQSYDDYQIGWAMFWSGLLGWDIHTILLYL